MDDALADGPADVSVSNPTLLADAFHDLEQFSVVLRHDGDETTSLRDVLRVGEIIAVLPVDLKRREVVLIRQFRLAAHLATGKGELLEIVAGHVEAGETPAVAAARECHEEIGVAADALHELFRFMPAPGSLDEHVTLFLGLVDAAAIPARAGAAEEVESTRPIRVPIDMAIAALERNTMLNGFLILALQWLALHRDRLDAIVAGPPSKR